MKSIIDEHQLRVMHTIAIYSASYAKIAKPAWWDKTKVRDCGLYARTSRLSWIFRISDRSSSRVRRHRDPSSSSSGAWSRNSLL
jgi:hypothetical protein